MTKKGTTTEAPPRWKNRVIGWDTVDPTQLLANPRNWRRHPAKQREALRGSLNELSIITPVIVNRTTGHLLDGHARVEEYISAGVTEVPVAYVELEPEKEALALLALDPIAAMAGADGQALDELLADVATGEAALQEMFAELAGLEYEPAPGSLDAGMRPGDGIAYEEQYGVIVMCKTEAEQKDVYERLAGEGFACRVVAV
jgi:hypothetical protein